MTSSHSGRLECKFPKEKFSFFSSMNLRSKQSQADDKQTKGLFVSTLWAFYNGVGKTYGLFTSSKIRHDYYPYTYIEQ
jgi:hypothetical protein